MPTNSPPVTRLAWIKRRARRLVCAFQITRREAVKSAFIDWHMFKPTATNKGYQS